ncbi:MAG: hypothetical protein LBC76_06005 [Treponema sp.]|nr:hypothetical protein [Treponema sp.]
MDLLKKEKLERLLKYGLVLAIVFCCILLLPQVRKLIIQIGEKVLGRGLSHDYWMNKMKVYSLYAMCFFSFFLILIIINVDRLFSSRYIKKIFIFASIGIVIMSFIVRIIMYIKCRSLWLDEAMLAESIISKNLFELLKPPLMNTQSAPVLYVIAVKFICLILGYSEFSLRLFSLLIFLGLLICEMILLKRAFNFDRFKIAFVVSMTALLPSYIWYSNEFKPYMGDAFFIVLIILLYFFYTQRKIKLSTLTILYILILGFSSPAIFFIGGMLFSEFFIAIFNKNKKQIAYIVISGTSVLVVFCLYYYWWMQPVSEAMRRYWGIPHVKEILQIFNTGVGNSDSSIIMFFVPFAFLGIIFFGKLKNKIVFSVILSLLFAFLASFTGNWPLGGRLWLFLPAIILFFTPIGLDFFYDKIRSKIIKNIMFFLFVAIIIYSTINCFEYIGDKMYFSQQEINPLIYYVQKNIKEDEKLYVYPQAKFAFDFKNNFKNTKNRNITKDKIIYGKNRNEWNESTVGNELLSILENKKTYLIFQHYWVGIERGLSVLQNYGNLTKVMDVHDTPLYYFEINESKDKEY